MSAPFIFVTTHKLNEAHLGQFEALTAEYMQNVEANEPQVLAQHAYLSADRSEVSFVHVHPDAESADRHMQVAGEQIGRGLALTEANLRIEVYGTPGPVLAQAIEANAAQGTTVSIKTGCLAGFSRS
jgi:hypothetical protein